jgi:hypothetical protein
MRVVKSMQCWPGAFDATTAEAREREQLRICHAFLLSQTGIHTRRMLVDAAVLALMSNKPRTAGEYSELVRLRLEHHALAMQPRGWAPRARTADGAGMGSPLTFRRHEIDQEADSRLGPEQGDR